MKKLRSPRRVAARMNQSTEMELSVVGPNPERGNVSSTQFSRPATMTACPRHSALFPSSRPSKAIRQRHARFGGKATGSVVGVGP
jgi:hypothetical protein